MDGDDDNEEDPFGFPIQETHIKVHINNVPPYDHVVKQEPHHHPLLQVEEEEMAKKVEEMDGDDDNEEDPLGFPIQYVDVSVHMKKSIHIFF